MRKRERERERERERGQRIKESDIVRGLGARVFLKKKLLNNIRHEREGRVKGL